MNQKRIGKDDTKYKLLIAGAFLPEINLLSIYGRGSSADKKRKLSVETLIAGVGSVQAALTLQKRLLDKSKTLPDEILLTGSCGYYDLYSDKKKHRSSRNCTEIGGIIFAKQFTRFEFAVLSRVAKVPNLLESRFGISSVKQGVFADLLAEKFLSGYNAKLPFCINSVDSVTTYPVYEECKTSTTKIHKEILSSIRRQKITHENMEAFGVAYTSNLHGIPASALLAVTNRVGPSGSREWKKNHLELSKTLQLELIEILESFL